MIKQNNNYSKIIPAAVLVVEERCTNSRHIARWRNVDMNELIKSTRT